MTTTSKINLKAVAIATIAAFISSGIWYMIWGDVLVKFSSSASTDTATQSMPAWKMLVEILRTLIVTFVFAWLLSAIAVNSYQKAVKIALIVWTGFPLLILTGSVVHENVPWQVASIHAGDWLVKPLVITIILTHFKIKRNAKLKLSNLAS